MVDLAEVKTKLEARLAEIDVKLHDIEEELDAHNSKDWEELAVEREEDEVLEQLGSAGLAEVAAIRAALKRIDDGEYGICAKCGEDIAPERLAILPATPLCARCAT